MPPLPRFCWVDGVLLRATEHHISAFDRGFQLGDGVFETLRARAGQVTELQEHMTRLKTSADGLEIRLPESMATEMERAIAELLAAEGLTGTDADAAIRITVTRGATLGRGLLPPEEGAEPTIVVQAWAAVPPPAERLERGLSIVASQVRRDPSNPLAALKTTARADYVFARLEARRAGADDALFLTNDGFLLEATSANLFLVQGDDVATPAIDCGILSGTTRGWVLGWARRAGLGTREGWLTTRDLVDADEAFLSSSVAGILPVTRFEGEPVGSGRPGPITGQARAAREQFVLTGDSGP
ncbi:MAG: aminotransferase class IV [Chloroflexi bacterium]|nr:aminotransferase class IV [Chloroflexota bacterium]